MVANLCLSPTSADWCCSGCGLTLEFGSRAQAAVPTTSADLAAPVWPLSSFRAQTKRGATTLNNPTHPCSPDTPSENMPRTPGGYMPS